MSVENIHHRALTTVADRSGHKPAAAPGRASPAVPTPGNADRPGGTLPDVKPDPKRATSPEIESGIRSLRNEHKILEGQKDLQTGIDDVVGRLAGGNLDDYARVNLATDDILRTYGGRKDLNDKDKAAVVKGVNEYLRRKVIDGFLRAKNAQSEEGQAAQSKQAIKIAVSYVTGPGPNPMSQKDRLIYLTRQMSIAGIDDTIIDDVKAQCEQSKKK
jgi:hypothetical protein